MNQQRKATSSVPKLSADCREDAHQFCSGRRWVGHDGRKGVYARCQCDCHKTQASA